MKAFPYFIILYLLVSSCSFSKKKSQSYFENAINSGPYDAIIAPGVPHDGKNWDSTMSSRVYWAVYLYKIGIAKNVIFSGGAVYTKYNEAKVMALYSKKLGVADDHIYLDTNAEHSTENVYFSYRIAKELGFKKIALATDPFQSKSLKGMISKLSLPIDIIPIVFDTLSTFDRPEPEIILGSTVKPDFISIKEREGFFKRLNGTMGKQILWYEEDLPNEKIIRKFKRKGRLKK